MDSSRKDELTCFRLRAKDLVETRADNPNFIISTLREEAKEVGCKLDCIYSITSYCGEEYYEYKFSLRFEDNIEMPTEFVCCLLKGV